MTPLNSTSTTTGTIITSTSVVNHQSDNTSGNISQVEPVVQLRQQQSVASVSAAKRSLESCTAVNANAVFDSIGVESGAPGLSVTAENLSVNKVNPAAVNSNIHKKEPHLSQWYDDHNMDAPPGGAHQVYDSAINIRNELEIPDISSLSLSEENNAGASSSEKAIKRHDSTSEAATLDAPPVALPDYFVLKELCKGNRIDELLAILYQLLENSGPPSVFDWFATSSSPSSPNFCVIQYPLHVMVDYASPEFLGTILEHFGEYILVNDDGPFGIDITDDKNQTPLHRAARNNNAEITSLLLSYGASCMVEDLWRETPCSLALKHRKNLSAARALASAGVDLSPWLPSTSFKQCTGHSQKHSQQRMCASNPEDSNLKSSHPDLINPILSHRTELLALQLEQPGVNVDVVIDAQLQATPLFLACAVNGYDSANILLKHNAKVNAGSWGTPLHMAIQSGSIEIIPLLLSYGAAVNRKTSEGNTPLHLVQMFDPNIRYRAQIGHITLVSGSLRKNDSARTNFHYNTSRLLILYGADTRITNAQGETPLHIASESGLPDVVQLLLEHHSSRQALDANNCSPMTLAERALNDLPATSGHTRKEDYLRVIHLLKSVPRLQGLSQATVRKTYTDEQLVSLSRTNQLTPPAIELIPPRLRALTLNPEK